MTITAEYLSEQQRLHQNPDYGSASIGYAPLVKRLINLVNADSVSDYGAGKQNLSRRLKRLGVSGVDYRPYDPAFPEYGPPRPADLVCCIDVLEHIEPDLLESVLQDLAAITVNTGLFTIHTGPAVKSLSDGRNAHIIQQPTSWWLNRLSRYFDTRHLQGVPNGFLIVVQPIGADGVAPLDPQRLNQMSADVDAAINPYPKSPVKSVIYKLGLMGVTRRVARKVRNNQGSA